jgi:hypothetical protein
MKVLQPAFESSINVSQFTHTNANGINFTVTRSPVEFTNTIGGFLLMDPFKNIVDYIAYGSSLTYDLKYTFQDIGVQENETTAVGYSLQRIPGTLKWHGPIPNTLGLPNLAVPTKAPTIAPAKPPSRSNCGFLKRFLSFFFPFVGC